MKSEELKQKIIDKLKREELYQVWQEIELPIIDFVDQMNQNGFKIDLDLMKETSKKFNQKIKELEKEIFDLAGEEFNIKSSQQLSKILFEKLNIPKKGIKKTASGYFSTQESELEKIKNEHLIVEKILEYRELTKMVSTYVDNLIPEIEKSSDGRLRYQILQIGTTTGRMSSRNPNIQNIPQRGEFGKEIRKFFVADKGYQLVSFDYSQIELRIAAILSQDQTLLESFQKGKDIHSEVALKVFGEAEGEARRKAKIINFGILYGMGINSLSKNLNSTRSEAQEYLNRYFETFSGLKKYIEGVKEYAYQNGYTKTLYGRKRYFSELKSKIPYIKANGERMAINAPIQGSAADIIKLAMKDIWELIKNNLDEVRPLVQVHDELIFEIKEEKVEEMSKIIKKQMEKVLEKYSFIEEFQKLKKVPLKVNLKIGDKWSELK